MKREKKMTISFSDDEIKLLRENASNNNMKESDYIRTVSCYGDTDLIPKSFIMSQLQRINIILDTHKYANPKLKKAIKKELKQIWQM